MFDLSSLTGVNNSQDINLKMQFGQHMQASGRLEEGQGYLYLVCGFVRTPETRTMVPNR